MGEAGGRPSGGYLAEATGGDRLWRDDPMSAMEPCEKCWGNGFVRKDALGAFGDSFVKCEACGGSGLVEKPPPQQPYECFALTLCEKLSGSGMVVAVWPDWVEICNG